MNGLSLPHSYFNCCDIFHFFYLLYRRYLNKRLCDYYLAPLLSISPQVLLIWLKYHNRDTNVDGIDNEIDEISDVYFWLVFTYSFLHFSFANTIYYRLSLFFSPSFLLYRANNKFDSTGWIDDILGMLPPSLPPPNAFSHILHRFLSDTPRCDGTRNARKYDVRSTNCNVIFRYFLGYILLLYRVSIH